MSRRSIVATSLLAGVLMIVAAGFVWAATPNQLETWNSGSTDGFFGYDSINQVSVPVNNPGDHLEMSFGSQGPPPLGLYEIRADATTAGGKFVGNYQAAGIASISFKFLCKTQLPQSVWLILHSPTSDSYWKYSLNCPYVGKWVQYNVPLAYSSGWTYIGGTLDQFRADIANVDWMAIRVAPGVYTPQTYALDDLVLFGGDPNHDSDRDGMSDYAESRAGTDPNNPDSKFTLSGLYEEGLGNVLIWNSVIGNVYDIWRTSDLLQGFGALPIASVLATDIVSEYVDGAATGDTPFFYQISIRE